MSFLKRFGLFLFLVLLIGSIDFYLLEKPLIGIDDANIFFKYAKNLSQGFGFVFNAGGERVEGFTSFLWVVICAFFFKVSSHPELLILLFLLFITTLVITLVHDEVKKNVEILNPSFSKKYFSWIYAGFIMAIGHSYITWSVLSLMETGLWNFIFISVVLLLLKGHRQERFSGSQTALLPLFGALLILARPEGIAWCCLFLIVLAAIEKKNRKNYWISAFFLISFLVTQAALLLFRKQYFGYYLPNTFYAKVSHDLMVNIKGGAQYALGFLVTFNPIISFLFVMVLAILLHTKKLAADFFKPLPDPREWVMHRVILVCLIMVLGVLFPFLTGGDHFGSWRFYQCLIPLLAWTIPGMIWIYQNINDHRYKVPSPAFFLASVFAFILLSAGGAYTLRTEPKIPVNYEFYLAKNGRQTANEFNNFWDGPKPSVGIITAGGFSLMYNGPSVDLMGLNNVSMGHSKGDRSGIKNHAAFNKDIFYQLKPDILIPQLMSGNNSAAIQYADLLNYQNFDNQAVKHIFNDPLFQQLYSPVVIQKNHHPAGVFAFARKDYLNQMKADTSLNVETISFNSQR